MRHAWWIALLLIGRAALADPQTERLWKSKCAACHGDDGKGQTAQGKKLSAPDLTSVAWQKQRSDAQLREAIVADATIERGGAKLQLHGYRNKLRADQIDALVAYVRGLGR